MAKAIVKLEYPTEPTSQDLLSALYALPAVPKV